MNYPVGCAWEAVVSTYEKRSKVNWWTSDRITIIEGSPMQVEREGKPVWSDLTKELL